MNTSIPNSGNSGFTIIDLMMTLALSGIISIGLYGFMTYINQENLNIRNHNFLQQQAQQAYNHIQISIKNAGKTISQPSLTKTHAVNISNNNITLCQEMNNGEWLLTQLRLSPLENNLGSLQRRYQFGECTLNTQVQDWENLTDAVFSDILFSNTLSDYILDTKLILKNTDHSTTLTRHYLMPFHALLEIK